MPEDSLPPDPFMMVPEEMLAMMKGLTQLYNASIMAGLPERTASHFIADVFIGLAVMNPQSNDNPPEDAVE